MCLLGGVGEAAIYKGGVATGKALVAGKVAAVKYFAAHSAEVGAHSALPVHAEIAKSTAAVGVHSALPAHAAAGESTVGEQPEVVRRAIEAAYHYSHHGKGGGWLGTVLDDVIRVGEASGIFGSLVAAEQGLRARYGR
jgi:hypothetical protein